MSYNNDSQSGASNLLTFLFGIGVGVVGTLIYAAINEDQFKQVVGRTKSLAGNVQDTVGDYADDATSRIKSVASNVQDTYNDSVGKIKDKASDVADSVQKAAKQAKSEINS